jgi:hypothetical protein
MIKKTVTYTDFNGVKRTEDFYFNLTEAELTELEYGVEGGFRALMEKIIAEHDQARLIEYFKKVVLMSYGEKSADGRRFVKSEEIRNGFAPTEAYSKIFMELATDADAASAFVNGILPNDVATKVEEAQANT